MAWNVYSLHAVNRTLLAATAEVNHIAHVHALNLPGIAVGQPEVWVLHLPSVLDTLLEDAIVVPDSVSPCYSSGISPFPTINVHCG